MQFRRKFLAAVLSVTMLVSQASGITAYAAQTEGQVSVQAEEKGKILELSFDGSASGLTSAGARVTMNGTLSYSNEAHLGQSMRFDGNAANYLSVTDENGGNLLKGYDSITISYWSNTPQTPGCNWATYLAPNSGGVDGNAPTYLAVSDQVNMRVERYRNGRSLEVTARGIKDTWKMVTIVVEPDKTTMYINARKRLTVSNANTLSSIIGENGVLYLGRANWGNGEGFTGWLDEYAIYNYAMDQQDIQNLYGAGAPAEELLQEALDNIHIPDAVTGNLTLPAVNEKGVAYTWTSSNESVISTKAVPCGTYYNEVDIPAGVVTRQSKDVDVTLKLKLSYKDAVKEKNYTVTVKAKPEKEEYVGYLYAHFNEHAGTTYDGIQQIFFGISKNGVDWTALNNNQFIAESTVGDYGVRDPYIIRSAEGDKFYLIATDLDIDSYKYKNKNNGSDWGLMSSQGSTALVVWESDDLVSWSEPRLVDVASEINAGMAWAPEAIYDEATGEYLVFWSSGKTNGKGNYIYVAKTRDFWNFTEPELYSNSADPDDGTPNAAGEATGGNIDASIFKEGDTYYRLIKDESDNSIRLQSAKKLLAYGKDLKDSDYVTVATNETEKMANRGALFTKINNEGNITVTDANGSSVTKPCLEQFARSYEGPTMFKFNDREEWCILVDEYGRGSAAGGGSARGYIPFVSTDLDRENSVYLPSDDEFVMPDAAKHGTVIPITQTEYDALMAKWGTPKQAGNRSPANSPVLKYDFENVQGQTVKDVSAAGAANDGALRGDAAVAEVNGKGKVLQLNGAGSLAFPQGFFDGLSNMTLIMDVCAQNNNTATVFSMGSTVKNKISSYTVSGGANGEIVEKRDRYWDSLIANKYLNLNITSQGVEGRITTFNDHGMFRVSTSGNQNMNGNWKTIMVTMDEHVMSIYIDGQLAAQNRHVRSVEELGNGLTAVLGAAYGADSGFKGYIDNVKVYNWTAESANLEEIEKANQEAADDVTSVIQGIGEITYDAASKEKIEAARKAYDALSDVQKSLVDISALVEAEETYARLEEEANTVYPISKAVIKNISAQNYTGKQIKPKLTITYDGKKLVQGTDYSVSYSGNIKIGTAQIKISGIGRYSGTTTKKFQITVSKGKTYAAGSYKYKMTNANTSGKGTVTVSGVSKKSLGKINVPDTVSIGGKKFKVTAIGDNAFKGCKKASSATIGKNIQNIGKNAFAGCSKLSKITIKAAKLKKAGKNAFKGISKKAVIKVPAKQLKKYKNLLKGKGQGKGVSIKK